MIYPQAARQLAGSWQRTAERLGQGSSPTLLAVADAFKQCADQLNALAELAELSDNPVPSE